MSTPITEETQAPSAAVPESPASTTESSNAASGQVDYNRLLDDDEYAAQVEQDLAASEGAASEPAQATDSPAAGTPAAAPADDPDPVVATITVEGREVQVRRSQSQPLMQKGRYMEVRFERAAPLLALERDAPDVVEMLRTPEGRKKALERLRATAPVPPAEAAVDTEGSPISPDDLALVDQRAEAKAREMLGRAGIRIPEPADLERERVERDSAERVVQSRIEALKDTDPEFDATIAAVRELVAEVQRTQPPEKAAAFLRAIDDPRNVHPESGKPLFVHLYHDARRWSQSRKAAAAPAMPPAIGGAAAPAALQRTTPRTITATLEPGSPAPRAVAGRAPGSPDYSTMSAKERADYFNRLADGD